MLNYFILGLCLLTGYFLFPKKRKPIIIYIEGNIGTGKTTLLNKLTSLIPNSVVCKEPVEEWISTSYENQNILDKFYHEKNRYAYMMQNIVYLTRVAELINTLKNYRKTQIILCERSVFTDKNVFALQAYQDKQINGLEWIWYNKWYNFLNNMFSKSITPNGFIYLQCDPSISYERIKKRSRKEECDIPFEYITKIHYKHENWFLRMDPNKYLRINCNNNFETDEKTLDNHVRKIKKFIKLIQ